MSSGISVGFMPAPQAVTSAATATGKPAAGDAGPLDFLAALLAIIGAGRPEPAGTDAETAKAGEATVTFAVPAHPDAAPPFLPLPEGIAPATPGASPSADDAAMEASDEALLLDLIQQLAALQDATSGTTPLDPLAEKKLTDTLDRLAAVLGIQLPQAQSIDPAISAAATVDATAAKAINPLADDPALPTPAAGAATVSGKATAPGAAPGAILPADGQSALPDASPKSGTAAAGADAPDDIPPALREIADKLAKLADTIAPRAPLLAERLDALAGRIASSELPPSLLDKLGLATGEALPESEIAKAVTRLLEPGTPTKPAAEPARFAAATLVLPELRAADEKQGAESKPPPSGALTAPVEADPDATDADPAGPKAARIASAAAEGDGPAKPDAGTRTSASAAAPAATASAADATAQQHPAVAPVPAATGTAVPVETKTILAAYKAPATQLNLPQIAIEIVRQVQAGRSRFEIRLDPPELGRVDVKLDMDSAGNVNARMTVDRAETLDLMQRDRPALERALAQAGLDSSKTNLEFSLRQNPFGREGSESGGSAHGDHQRHASSGARAPAEPALADTASTHRVLAASGGVNLFV